MEPWKYSYLFLSQEFVENTAEDGLKAGRDDVERDVVPDAEVVELKECRIDLQSSLHDLESILKRDVQASPHLLRNFTERPRAILDLIIELFPPLDTTSVSIKQDVPSILHENCTIEICQACQSFLRPVEYPEGALAGK